MKFATLKKAVTLTILSLKNLSLENQQEAQQAPELFCNLKSKNIDFLKSIPAEKILATGFLDTHVDTDGCSDKCQEILKVVKNPISVLSLLSHGLLDKPMILEGFAK